MLPFYNSQYTCSLWDLSNTSALPQINITDTCMIVLAVLTAVSLSLQIPSAVILSVISFSFVADASQLSVCSLRSSNKNFLWPGLSPILRVLIASVLKNPSFASVSLYTTETCMTPVCISSKYHQPYKFPIIIRRGTKTRFPCGFKVHFTNYGHNTSCHWRVMFQKVLILAGFNCVMFNYDQFLMSSTSMNLNGFTYLYDKQNLFGLEHFYIRLPW